MAGRDRGASKEAESDPLARIHSTLESMNGDLKQILQRWVPRLQELGCLDDVPDGGLKVLAQVEVTPPLAVIASEITLELVQSLDILRDAGHFIEYPSDAAPPSPDDPSVLTVAEGLPTGLCRMYWLNREQFPSLHNLRDQRGKIASHALNAISQLLSDSE
jgi:hypothetical protein